MIQRTDFRLAVFVVIRDDAGRVLLQRRAGTEFMNGYYDFPSGHVDTGESFTEAAIRELAEETGLIVDESDLEVLHLNQNYLDLPYINVVFNAKKWSGTPQILESDKCDDQRLMPCLKNVHLPSAMSNKLAGREVRTLAKLPLKISKS